jgi:hypothetical protein
MSRGRPEVRRLAFLLAASLVLLTGALVLYRILWLGYPILPLASGQTWQLVINAYITPHHGQNVLSLGLPLEHTGHMIVEERVVSGVYAFDILKQGANRLGVWSGAGVNTPEEITYRATIHALPRSRVATQSPRPTPYPPAISAAERKIAEEVAVRWQTLGPEAQLQAVAAVVRGNRWKELPDDDALRQWRIVQQKRDRTDATLALLSASDLPARTAEGLRLTDGVQTLPIKWIEVWTGRSWRNLDAETGQVYSPTAVLLPLAVDGARAVSLTGADLFDIRWTIIRQVISQWKLLYERIVRSPHFLDRWSLLQLPPEFQGTFRILLLVPIGALVISIMRNVVGLPTFGVFMPLLIALAFRSTGVFYGVVIFCGVLLVGFFARSLLDKLHLLLVPRLSVILTLVIACFTVLALVGNRLGLRELMAVGLIPFVILTMTIERFFIIMEESGAKEALLTAAGTTAVSVVSYGIIGWEPLQLTFFVYPELILTVAALQILLGRYTGYRLSELFRFRNVGGSS